MTTQAAENAKRLSSFHTRVYVGSEGCWLWLGAPNNGYGRIMVEGKNLYAHRWAYETFVGPIPEGMEIDHTCNMTMCVKPAHLEPVTPDENKRRAAERRTHCHKGHPLTRPPGGKGVARCLVCYNEKEERKRARQRRRS